MNNLFLSELVLLPFTIQVFIEGYKVYENKLRAILRCLIVQQTKQRKCLSLCCFVFLPNCERRTVRFFNIFMYVYFFGKLQSLNGLLYFYVNGVHQIHMILKLKIKKMPEFDKDGRILMQSRLFKLYNSTCFPLFYQHWSILKIIL